MLNVVKVSAESLEVVPNDWLTCIKDSAKSAAVTPCMLAAVLTNWLFNLSPSSRDIPKLRLKLTDLSSALLKPFTKAPINLAEAAFAKSFAISLVAALSAWPLSFESANFSLKVSAAPAIPENIFPTTGMSLVTSDNPLNGLAFSILSVVSAIFSNSPLTACAASSCSWSAANTSIKASASFSASAPPSAINKFNNS